MTPRVGIELELCAPLGTTQTLTRDDLGAELAKRIGGTTERFHYFGAEPSAHPQFRAFHNLTPGCAVIGRDGQRFATLVDDSTLNADLRRDAPAVSGWHRLVSDERRVLSVLGRLIDPAAATDASLNHACSVLGLEQVVTGDLRVLAGADGETYAVVAPLSGERERVAEIASAPLSAEELCLWLEITTTAAADLGFTVAIEAATHVHFDAAPFDRAWAFRRLVLWFHPRYKLLRSIVGTNPLARAIGRLPDGLLTEMNRPELATDAWPATKARLLGTGVSKFADLNLANLLGDGRRIPTIEFRSFPGSMDAPEIARWAFGLGGCLAGLLVPDREVDTGDSVTEASLRAELERGRSRGVLPGENEHPHRVRRAD